MRSLLKSASSVSVFTFITLASASAFAEFTQERLLVGKWLHYSIQRTDDGRVSPAKISETKGVGQFSAGKTWSLESETVHSSGTYRWIDKDHIEQKIVNSSLPVQIGSTSTKKVNVNAKRLELIVTIDRAMMDKNMGAIKPGERRPNETVIHTIFNRMDSASDQGTH